MSPLPADKSAAEAIEAQGLCKDFGHVRAVRDVGFVVHEGEVFAFLGPNGSGKTTTLRILLGLLAPTHGCAQVLGFDPQRHARRLRQEVGYVTQLHSLYQELTIGENLRFFAQVYGLRGKRLEERLAEVVDRFRLAPHLQERAGTAPSGIRRRSALAAALLHRPRALLLDEPTGGMDALARRRFWSFVGDLTAEGTTVLVTTHHLEEAEGCDRVGLMIEGRLAFVGTPRQLKERFGVPVTVVTAEPWEPAFLALRQVYSVSLFGRTIHVEGADEGDVRRVLAAAGCRALHMEVKPPELEDAFLRAVDAGSDREAPAAR